MSTIVKQLGSLGTIKYGTNVPPQEDITCRKDGTGRIVTVFKNIKATSSQLVRSLANAKAISLQLMGDGDVGDRTAVLTIKVSADKGANFSAYNMIIDNATTLARVASKSLATIGASMVWLDPITLGGITDIVATVTITDGQTAPQGSFSLIMTVVY